MALYQFLQNPYLLHRNEPVPQITPLGGAFPLLYRSLQLRQLSYEPQALLQRTRELFEYVVFNDVLRASVKHHFGVIFLGSQQDPFITEAELQVYMQLFDIFFFAGNLTGASEPLVTLEFREDIFGQWPTYEVGRDILWGRASPQYTDIGNPRMAVRVRIELEALQPQLCGAQFGRRPLVRLLKTLLHEMVHAYFVCFSCTCNLCCNQLGATGHGPVWQELMRAIFREMGSWDRSLWEFCIEDQHNLD